jgi:hypothetical protein
MNLKTDETYTFKLNSGEELVAKVTQVNDNYVLLDTPVSIAPGPQGMGLMPSLFTNDQRGKVRLVKLKYLEATTGIQVPSKKMILG